MITEVPVLLEIQEIRHEVFDRTQIVQEKMEKKINKKTKPEDFQMGDLVLKWDAKNEDDAKKFDCLWYSDFSSKQCIYLAQFRRRGVGWRPSKWEVPETLFQMRDLKFHCI